MMMSPTPEAMGPHQGQRVAAHIPLERVRESTRVLRELGGEVTERIYPGMGHTINEDEVRFVRGLLAGLVASDPGEGL